MSVGASPTIVPPGEQDKTHHHLIHRRRKIPSMHPQQINIPRPQPLQTPLNRQPQILPRIARKITPHPLSIPGRAPELGRKDDFVTVAALCHPLADPALRLAELVHVGRVDEIPALLVERVEDGEGGGLGAFAHERRPGAAEVHGA